MTLARSPRCLVMLALLTCFAVASLSGAQPSVAATKTCSAPTYPDSDRGGYFTKVRVTNVSCASGRKLVRAYYTCRRKKGVKGSCHGRTVNNLRCTERRPASGDNGVEFNATVTCKRGSKKVVHSYQQNYGS